MIIEGPAGMSKVYEANNPQIDDVKHSIDDKTIICMGVLIITRAVAAGIINNEVISNMPIMLIDTAINIDNNIMNSISRILVFSFATIARSVLIVIKSHFFH